MTEQAMIVVNELIVDKTALVPAVDASTQNTLLASNTVKCADKMFLN